MQKKILVVDDEPNNLKLLKQILAPQNYKLAFAKSGQEALEGVKKHSPDLILLDIMMPEMDGYEVCRRLKNDPITKHIPVIFVTAMSDVEDEQKGFDIGCVDYITKPISEAIVLARIKTHLSLVKVDELALLVKSTIEMLGEAGHYNDTDTGSHIWRMAAYCAAIARALGWDEDNVKSIELAATMHDTGKIGIPDNILKAPRRLDSEEWQVMMSHSKMGFDILSKSNNPLCQLAALIALEHHEKWDGSGYPNQLRGDEISEAARIVAIADIFDALTMKRPYKEAWSVEDSIEEIKKLSGKHLDPKIVDKFLEIKDEILKIKHEWEE